MSVNNNEPRSVVELVNSEEPEWFENLHRPTLQCVTVNSKVKKCSFCREPGHNIRNCNSPSRMWIMDNINAYIRVEDGYYSIRNNSDQYIDYSLNAELMNEPIPVLTMYCIMLQIPTPKRKTVLRDEVKKEILRLRKIRKDAWMTEQVELFKTRFNEIITIHRRVLELENQNILNEEISIEIETLNGILFGKINEYRSEYDSEPELYYVLRERMIDNEKQATRKIPVKSITCVDVQEKECPICYDTFPIQKSLITQCSHTFCVSCITRSVQSDKENKCPCCRTKITEFTHYCSDDENQEKIQNIPCFKFV